MTYDLFSSIYYDESDVMFKLPSVEMILAQQGIKIPNGSLWHDIMTHYKDCYGRTLYDIKFKYIKEWI